ncbi:histidine utilization repressor [Aliiglaciecola litoralis]|uniref:Histidine utilization repressor n=1 Tax=Aliiglaciecola litoralis TaxID=582857 RepID=A0ABN1LRS9_9ALTE
MRIKSALLARIEAGEMVPGAQVPSENQLSEEFQVSRMTARRALTELVDEGILIRSQGLGTFVSDHRPMSSMLEITSIDKEVLSRGHIYSNKVIHQSTVVADASQSALFSLAAGDELFHTQIIHYESGVAIQLEKRWVNPVQAPAYLQQDFSKTTANQYLNKVAPLTQADHVIEALLPDDEIANYLNIAQLQPCLMISRRTYSAKGIVSYARLYHPGNRYRLGGHLDFNSQNRSFVNHETN